MRFNWVQRSFCRCTCHATKVVCCLIVLPMMYRDDLSQIDDLLQKWMMDDVAQSIPGFEHLLMGADTNTKLIGGIEGTTGDMVLENGAWDDRVSYLFDFLTKYNLRALNTFDGVRGSLHTWENTGDAKTQSDILFL